MVSSLSFSCSRICVCRRCAPAAGRVAGCVALDWRKRTTSPTQSNGDARGREERGERGERGARCEQRREKRERQKRGRKWKDDGRRDQRDEPRRQEQLALESELVARGLVCLLSLAATHATTPHPSAPTPPELLAFTTIITAFWVREEYRSYTSPTI